MCWCRNAFNWRCTGPMSVYLREPISKPKHAWEECRFHEVLRGGLRVSGGAASPRLSSLQPGTRPLSVRLLGTAAVHAWGRTFAPRPGGLRERTAPDRRSAGCPSSAGRGSMRYTTVGRGRRFTLPHGHLRSTETSLRIATMRPPATTRISELDPEERSQIRCSTNHVINLFMCKIVSRFSSGSGRDCGLLSSQSTCDPRVRRLRRPRRRSGASVVKRLARKGARASIDTLENRGVGFWPDTTKRAKDARYVRWLSVWAGSVFSERRTGVCRSLPLQELPEASRNRIFGCDCGSEVFYFDPGAAPDFSRHG